MRKEELSSGKKILWGIIGFVLGLGITVLLSGIVFILVLMKLGILNNWLTMTFYLPIAIVGVIGIILCIKAKNELKYIGYGMCVYIVTFFLRTLI